MAVNKVDYRAVRTEDTSRNPSPQIWGDIPVADIQEDAAKGYFYREDFTNVALLASPTITTQANYQSGWKAFGSTPGTVLGANVEGGQGLALVSGTSDNDGISIATLATPVKISRAKGAFAWEARLKVSSIGDTIAGVLAGLIEATTLTAIVPITAAGALADKNLVGFFRLEGDGDQLDTVYKADGVTAVTVKADALADLPTTTALTASTYVKLGMKYEPTGPYGAYQFSWFVNGYRLPDRYTMASADGTDFPNDVQLALLFAAVNATGAAHTVTVDWVQVAQLYVS